MILPRGGDLRFVTLLTCIVTLHTIKKSPTDPHTAFLIFKTNNILLSIVDDFTKDHHLSGTFGTLYVYIFGFDTTKLYQDHIMIAV